MNAGIVFLVLAYVMSQFYRAFLAVMAPALGVDIGAGPEDLAFASGMWFLVFAAMQIPVGEALDRIGPRITASVLFAIGGGGGAALFALASTPLHITLAMMLIGVGCSPVLMASYYIFARSYAPAVFATLAGVTLGIGTFGNIGSALPLTLAVEWFGWRGTMWVLTGVTLFIALMAAVFVRDPERVAVAQKGSVLDLLAMPVLWPILAMMAVNYISVAGLRGLWVGPYLDEVFAATPEVIGVVTLVMSFAMVAGNFVYGPMDRLIPSRKTIVLGGNLINLACVLLLILFAGHSVVVATVLLAMIGLTGATFVVIIAHAKTFFPEHLTGRGVTLLNLFGMGGTGLLQSLSGNIYGAVAPQSTAVVAYQWLFGFFALCLLAGCVAYVFSRDGKNIRS
ncbi:MFS transporter [Neptunicoccus cionae]|uniref:MFS transporter n=1 Tax=Neptunicoccus cionae TaxID=2035344 RepID=UPI000C7713D1|nr:MFS transporter [Amylibacter cionae]PLS19878.1 MFS transporter [Amylibacter cionae]